MRFDAQGVVRAQARSDRVLKLLRYCGHLMGRVLARIPLRERRQILFLVHHGRLGHLERPVTFNEKVNWRIIHDRRPSLVWTCDKVAVKLFAADLGIAAPKTYWFGESIESFPFDDLPSDWVLKPNNATGQVLFGNSAAPDGSIIRSTVEWWRQDRRLVDKGEWAYSIARPGFILEERIGPVSGTPNDYKVYVFDGVPHVVLVDVDRFGAHTSCFYSSDWLPMSYRDRIPRGIAMPRPPLLEDMLEKAARVAHGFDFLRVDFYLEGDQVYLGEVTPYPGGGLEPFIPRSADVQLGLHWHLPDLTGE